MITIVAHGILGTTYRQDIVIDSGAQSNGDAQVLHDIRQHLSTQYGDGTPITGWALSPAPSGMWLNRVERAFDANYTPAYLMVSVLIPRGQQLKDDTVLNKISRAMILNHSKFIKQNVIQYECDWSFLHPLSQEIEECLVPVDGDVSNYTDPTNGEIAYYEGDLSRMIQEMWSGNFTRFGTVFYGKALLLSSANLPNVAEMNITEQLAKQEEKIRCQREEEARVKQEEERLRKEEEEARRRKEEEEARIKLEEEACRSREEEKARMRQEEERCRRREEEESRLIPEEIACVYDPPVIGIRKDKEKKKQREINDNDFGLIEGADYNRHGVGLAVANIIATLLGGWLGIILSIILLGNIKVRGVTFHKYRKGERIVAIVCLVLAPVIMLFWILAFLGMMVSHVDENGVETSTYTANGISFNMKKVKGGTFMMGTDSQETGVKEWEKPAHWVTLSDYCIGETEVTQELWEAVMGKNSNISDFKGAKLPVERVSWEDCQVFLAKLNNMTGEEFRLPTEAEWEFAARGGQNSQHYKYSGSNDINEVAWYYRNSGDNYIDWGISQDTTNYLTEVNHCRPHPVKQKKPNELGIYDMTGNVLEWCSDWYDRYSAVSLIDPQGPKCANPDKYGRVRRGGYYLQSENYSRITYRIKTRPEERHEWLGLRLALSLY